MDERKSYESDSDEALKTQIVKDLRENNKRINASYIQWKYRIGYARASRVADELAAEGKLRVIKYYVLPPEPVVCEDEAE